VLSLLDQAVLQLKKSECLQQVSFTCKEDILNIATMLYLGLSYESNFVAIPFYILQLSFYQALLLQYSIALN